MHSWECLARRPGGTVAGLATALSGTGQTVVFAATPVGVYRSTDEGQTWTLPGVGPTVPFAEVVAPSPRYAQDRIVFVCGADGLYRSSDAGETWQRVLVGSRMLSVVIVSPDDRQDRLVILAGTETDGILRSEDTGRTWTGANAGLLDITAISLAVSPCFETDRTGFAGAASGMYRTRNGGRSWRSVDTGLDDPAVQCLAVSPNFANDQLVLAGTEADGLLRSTDGGASWHSPPSLASGGIAVLAFAAGYPSPPTVAAATESGMAVSHDGGETWQTLDAAPRQPALSLVFLQDGLLAGLYRDGISRSADGGSTWQLATEGLNARLDTQLVPSPDFARDRTLFVGGLEDGVRASTDGGTTWEADHTTGVEELAVYGFAVSTSEKTVYAATSAGIRLSRDGAKTWRQPGAGDGPARVVATGSGIALAAFEGGRLLASEDGGHRWRTIPAAFDGTEIIALAVSPSYPRDRTLFVATADSAAMTLWRSTDSGERWRRWLVEPVGGLSRVPLALASSYAIDESVFVGLGGRVFKPRRHAEEVRSGERRPVWRAADLGRETVGVTALDTSPEYGQDHTLFAATNAGVFVSRNGGETFQPWNAGLVPPRMVCVAVSPTYSTDRLVFALGLGGTVWRRHDDRKY